MADEAQEDREEQQGETSSTTASNQPSVIRSEDTSEEQCKGVDAAEQQEEAHSEDIELVSSDGVNMVWSAAHCSSG